SRKPMPFSKQAARQIRIVIDFAVEHDDDGAVFIEDRLFAPTEVDDAQAPVPKTNVVLDEVSVIVRPTVRLNRRHALDKFAIDWMINVEIDDPANPAHKPSLRALHVR